MTSRLLRLLRSGGLRCWLSHRRQILAGSNVGHVRQASDLAASGIVDADASMVEQLSGGAIQFDPRLFIGDYRIHESGFGRGKLLLKLQTQSREGSAELILLLRGAQGL